MAPFFDSRGCLPPPILAGCFRLPLPPAEKRIYRTRDININSNLRTCRCRCLDARSWREITTLEAPHETIAPAAVVLARMALSAHKGRPPWPPDPCTAFSVYQQHQEPSSEEQQQAQRSSRTTRSWFGTMEYPECHICKMIFNGELQFLDHLKGKRHRKHLKKAHRRQMELKLTVEPDDKAPPAG